MTRKDYRLLAEVIASSLEREWIIERAGNDTAVAQVSIKILAEDLAGALAKQNKAFDKELFLRNCGVKE